MGKLILNSLEIRNFRCFQHLQIERLGRVNLIVGKNNVGKTSLLEALQLYASKASTPTFIWDILTARNEIRLPLVSVENMLTNLKYLFYGRRDIRPGLEQIVIGSIDTPGQIFSIAVDWSILEANNNIRSLQLGEDYADENLIPRFLIHTGASTLNYPIDPSLRPIVRLNSTEITCCFVSSNGLRAEQIKAFWDGVTLTPSESDVLKALRFIAPGVEGLNLASTPASEGERYPLVKIVGIDEPLFISSLGDGMQRVLGIALALVNAKDGLLLIDEFENGIHYSAQPDLWRLIFEVAHRLNVQVFATTHSWDCIQAFQQAAKENQQEEGLLIRLESKKGEIGSTLYDERRLSIAARQQIEVR